jgi:uncharacterized protein (TIRG00374 family)
MKRIKYRSLLAGILLLCGFAYSVLHYGDVSRFVELLLHIDPLRIVAAMVLQAGTYFSLALVWYRVLAVNSVRYPFVQLVPLALAKLFADQALPSGGISGIAFVIGAFKRRDVSGAVGMGVMLLSLLSFYLAYAIVAVVSFMELLRHHDIHRWMLVVSAFFLMMVIIVPGAILLLMRQGGQNSVPEWRRRMPVIAGITGTFAGMSDDLLRKPWLMFEVTLYQTLIFLLDSATLWAMLSALGEMPSPLLVFPCFVMASVVATVSLIPLGLGSFEITCAGLLVSLGIGIEPAVTATLLLRGFTLWMPMIPGLLITRREFG